MAILDVVAKRVRWFIYVLRDPCTNEIRYVGKSRNLRDRFAKHVCSSRKPKRHVERWVASIIARGELPHMEIIDAGLGSGDCAAERAWIREHRLRGTRLTNASAGGDGGHGPLKESTKRLLAAVHLGKPKSPETRLKMRLAKLGKKQSPEHIRKRSEARKGYVYTPEHRERIAASKRGNPRDAATRAKLSVAQTGQKKSPEDIEKSASKRRGKRLSPETRQRMSDARKGIVFSAEHRHNISEARRAYLYKKANQTNNGEPEEGSG